jgi:hypothetical protein
LAQDNSELPLESIRELASVDNSQKNIQEQETPKAKKNSPVNCYEHPNPPTTRDKKSLKITKEEEATRNIALGSQSTLHSREPT